MLASHTSVKSWEKYPDTDSNFIRAKRIKSAVNVSIKLLLDGSLSYTFTTGRSDEFIRVSRIVHDIVSSSNDDWTFKCAPPRITIVESSRTVKFGKEELAELHPEEDEYFNIVYTDSVERDGVVAVTCQLRSDLNQKMNDFVEPF